MALSALALACLLAPPADARFDDDKKDKKSPETPEVVPDTPELDQLMLAGNLAVFGRANANPEALVVAARIKMKTPVKVENDKGELITDPALSKEIEGLLDEAAKMRPADKVVAELVKRARGELKEASRGLWEVYKKESPAISIASREVNPKKVENFTTNVEPGLNRISTSGVPTQIEVRDHMTRKVLVMGTITADFRVKSTTTVEIRIKPLKVGHMWLTKQRIAK